MGVIATPVFYLFVMLSSGGGHSYVSLMIFSPFAALVALALDVAWLYFALSILQFPAYGLILWRARRKNSYRLAVIILLVVHLAASAICLVTLPKTTAEQREMRGATTGQPLRASKRLPA